MSNTKQEYRAGDRRVAVAIRGLLANLPFPDPGTDTPWLPSFFPAQPGAIYRIPLDVAEECSIGSLGTPELHEFKGHEYSLFLADPYPLAEFSKPVAAVLYENDPAQGQSNQLPEPVLVLPAAKPLIINGHIYDLQNAAELARWQIDGDPIPAPIASPPIPRVEVFADILSGPFPRENPADPAPSATPPMPKPDDPPPDSAHPRPLTPPPNGTTYDCKPTTLYYGLNLDCTIAGFMPGVEDAFRGRGYTGKTLVAGQDDPGGSGKLDTFEKLMGAFVDDLAKHTPPYCNCPEDQLVILLHGHGGEGRHLSLGFTPVNGSSPLNVDVLFSKFATWLAMTPVIREHPEKVVLIVAACHSGTILSGGDSLPGSLRGMHVITSATDPRDKSYGIFIEQIGDALKRPECKTWLDFINWLKYQRALTAGTRGDALSHQPPIRCGIVGNCEMTVIILDASVSGVSLGKVNAVLRANKLEWTPPRNKDQWIDPPKPYGGKSAFVFGTAALADCGGKVKIEMEASVYAQDASGTILASANDTRTVEFLCNGKGYDDGTVSLDMKDSSGQTETVKFTLHIASECK